MTESTALITNDAVVLGLLTVTLGLIFYTANSERPVFKAFYKYVPTLLLCYFIPGLYNTFGVIDADNSKLYFVASRYLLPASLILLTISIDLPAVMKLGYKALIMFFTATVSIVIGGPLAIIAISTVSPETIGGSGPEAVWRGMTTVAGSWIGGGANQAAMKEVFEVGDNLYGRMVAVDVIWANIWMAVLLVLASKAHTLDTRMGADTAAIEHLKKKVEQFHEKHSRPLAFDKLMYMVAIAFGLTGLGHAVAGQIAPWIAANAPALERMSLTSEFLWIVVIATTGGLILSFTKARELEGAGASKIGSGLLYILIASIGMHMDIKSIFEDFRVFAIGGVWMSFHAAILLTVAKIIRAPTFYMAVGSQANVGGAASAPVVASAFHPALAPVGVLLAVLGYALGTYAAWFCGQLMRIVAT